MYRVKMEGIQALTLICLVSRAQTQGTCSRLIETSIIAFWLCYAIQFFVSTQARDQFEALQRFVIYRLRTVAESSYIHMNRLGCWEWWERKLTDISFRLPFGLSSGLEELQLAGPRRRGSPTQIGLPFSQVYAEKQR